MKVAPNGHELAHRAIKIITAASQGRGIQRARRRAANDGEGVGLVLCATNLAQVGNGFEHTHLVGRTCAATGEHEGGGG